MKYPRSPYDTEGGLVYLPRMLDKIRMDLAGEIGDDYREYLGKGFDGRCCQFLRVDYEAVKAQVAAGKDDVEILARV